MKQDVAKPGYHHGALRAALLAAAEEELGETGVENFSLRSCARRAGVSHAAPKHHFGSVEGLLDALAAVGFDRLTVLMGKRVEAASTPHERLLASGAAYVDFARANPALFKLMFSAGGGGTERASSGALAFDILRRCATKAAPDAAPGVEITASWAVVHGLAHLLIERPAVLGMLMGERAPEAFVEQTLRRILPR